MRKPLLRFLFPTLLFASTALIGTSAYAGEIKIGQDKELETNENGTLTAGGKKGAVTELDNVPEEDLWVAYFWAKIDRGAEGPLYVEFFQDINGQKSIVHRHEEANYDGGKYVNIPIELEGNVGFNKDRTYTIKVVQTNAKGKDIVLATGKIKLIKSGRKAPEGDGGGGGDEKDDQAAQDELDSLGGPDDEEETGDEATPPEPETGGDEAPPPVEPKKKGCSVDAQGDAYGFSGPAILLLVAGGLLGSRRRRR